MVIFPIHQVWPNHLARQSEKAIRKKADKGRGEEITSANEQAWSLAGP